MTARLSVVIEYQDESAMPALRPMTLALGGRVVAIALGDTLIDPDGPAMEMEKLLAGLSDRERQTLALLCDGLDAQEIGKRIGVSKATVHSYRYRIHEHLNVKNDIQAVTMFIRNKNE